MIFVNKIMLKYYYLNKQIKAVDTSLVEGKKYYRKDNLMNSNMEKNIEQKIYQMQGKVHKMQSIVLEMSCKEKELDEKKGFIANIIENIKNCR